MIILPIQVKTTAGCGANRSGYPAGSHKHAESLNLTGWTNEWCGDVWKAVCHLRSLRENIHVFVLDTDYGLGIITKGEPENRLNLLDEQIADLTWADFEKNREHYLNLKPVGYFQKFLESLRPVSR